MKNQDTRVKRKWNSQDEEWENEAAEEHGADIKTPRGRCDQVGEMIFLARLMFRRVNSCLTL